MHHLGSLCGENYCPIITSLYYEWILVIFLKTNIFIEKKRFINTIIQLTTLYYC